MAVAVLALELLQDMKDATAGTDGRRLRKSIEAWEAFAAPLSSEFDLGRVEVQTTRDHCVLLCLAGIWSQRMRGQCRHRDPFKSSWRCWEV